MPEVHLNGYPAFRLSGTPSQLRLKRFGELIEGVDEESYDLHGSASLQIGADLKIPGSTSYAVIQMAPKAMLDYRVRKEGTTTKRLLLKVNHFGIGLRGKIGDRIEYMAIPAITPRIVLGSLEVRYTFGSLK